MCVMCVCLRLCVHDPNGAPIIVRLREGETSREGSYGPPIFHHLRFLSIDCCDCPRSHVSLCVCVHCLRLLSILLMAIDNHSLSSLFLPPYKSLPVWVNLLPIHPSLPFSFFILLLLSPFLSLLSHHLIPPHSPCHPPFLWSGERRVREEEEY